MEPMIVSQHIESQDQIDQDAALWVARLAGDRLPVGEHRRLEGWLDADPRHRTAFLEAQEAWGLMGGLAAERDLLVADVPAATVPTPPPPVRFLAVGRALAAIAACLLLVVMGGTLWLGGALPHLTVDHATAPGEQRVVLLEDGSRVILGPGSALDVRYGAAMRRVVLRSGVAIFDVAPMAEAGGRPFVVAAGSGTVRALGTEFMVEYHAEAIEVTVLEHAVEVALEDDAGTTQAVRLDTGASVRYDAQAVGEPHRQDVARATAWQRQRLIFDRVPLADVVAALNRYRPGRIVIADAALAARTVSGVFHTATPDLALDAVIRELGAKSAAIPPLVTVIY